MNLDCDCLERGPRRDAATHTYFGVDETAARFADVELFVCATCGRTWLYYSWEVEAFTASGRWYAGVVSPDVIADLTPQGAPSILKELPWRLVGGSHFGGDVSRQTVVPDL